MNTGKIVLGTMAGLAIGAIAGILLAPEKGSTTRKKIMDKTADSVEELISKFDEFRDSLSDKIKSSKNDAEDLVEKGKAKYEDAKKNVENAAANLKHNGARDIKHATS